MGKSTGVVLSRLMPAVAMGPLLPRFAIAVLVLWMLGWKIFGSCASPARLAMLTAFRGFACVARSLRSHSPPPPSTDSKGNRCPMKRVQSL